MNTPDNSDIGYFLEVDLSYLYKMRQKNIYFPICPENKSESEDVFDDYMTRIKPKNFM